MVTVAVLRLLRHCELHLEHCNLSATVICASCSSAGPNALMTTIQDSASDTFMYDIFCEGSQLKCPRAPRIVGVQNLHAICDS